MFNYTIDEDEEKINDLEIPPTKKMVEQFISRFLYKMKLTNEVCLISLIFIERLVVRCS